MTDQSVGAIIWTHYGYKYALGFADGVYGIYEKETWQSGPVATFPGNDQGWEAALAQFEACEPRGWVTVLES